MAHVELAIGGRNYAVACRDGGEDHLRALALRVDEKVTEARGAVGTTNESRQLLFAALLLADDVAAGVAERAAAPPPVAEEDSVPAAALAGMLAGLADRLEGVADLLEAASHSAASDGVETERLPS